MGRIPANDYQKVISKYGFKRRPNIPNCWEVIEGKICHSVQKIDGLEKYSVNGESTSFELLYSTEFFEVSPEELDTMIRIHLNTARTWTRYK